MTIKKFNFGSCAIKPYEINIRSKDYIIKQ